MSSRKKISRVEYSELTMRLIKRSTSAWNWYCLVFSLMSFFSATEKPDADMACSSRSIVVVSVCKAIFSPLRLASTVVPSEDASA